ncbi:MAG: SUMF1/EgtB/PvdO family nonheme iron enzyme [Planctomycetes bacterium]|nr:SUMF1/EgtB/PvdO family nonheme iron enzyme [Planctomycetota bacterium]
MRTLFVAIIVTTLLAIPATMQEKPATQPAKTAPAKSTDGSINTSIGKFTALGINAQGYKEFRRERDGSVMVLIPAGQYQQLSYTSGPDEEPEIRSLIVENFLIDKYEITNSQGSKFLTSSEGLTYKDNEVFKDETRLARTHKLGIAIGKSPSVLPTNKNLPFVGATGHGALEYAAWVGANLPYAYEWQKAAAGPSGLWLPWGSTSLPDSTLANSFLHGPKRSLNVGSFPKGISAYGLLDCAGNVSERVYHFNRVQDIDPEFFPVMLKGGSWATTHWANLRCNDEDYQKMDVADGTVGFRTVIRKAEVIAALGIDSKPILRIMDNLDDALEEAAKRNVPVLLFLSNDTCGRGDRIRAEIFTNDKFIEYMNSNCVVLAGNNFGDAGEGNGVDSQNGPSLLYNGCAAEKIREVYDEFCVAIDVSRIPEAIWDFKVSPGVFALNPHEDLFDEAENLLLVGESEFPKNGEAVSKYIANMKKAQKALGVGQSRVDFVAGKEAPETIWAPPEDEDEDE